MHVDITCIDAYNEAITRPFGARDSPGCGPSPMIIII